MVGAFAFALLFGLLNAGGTYAAAPEPTAVAQMGSLFTSNVDAGSIMTASAGLIAAAIAALLILVVAPSWGLGLARRPSQPLSVALVPRLPSRRGASIVRDSAGALLRRCVTVARG